MKDGFIGQNLRLMRLFHGLSLQELGDEISVSKQFLSRLESGVEAPSSSLQDALGVRLRVLDGFFHQVDPMPISDEQCHFRKQLTTKVALRQQARARGELFKRITGVLCRRSAFAGRSPSSEVKLSNDENRKSLIFWCCVFGR